MRKRKAVFGTMLAIMIILSHTALAADFGTVGKRR